MIDSLQANTPPTAAQFKAAKSPYLITEEPLSMWSVALDDKVKLAYPYHAIARIDYITDDQSAETMMITLGKNMVVVTGKALVPIFDAIRRHKLDKLRVGGAENTVVTEINLADIEDEGA